MTETIIQVPPNREIYFMNVGEDPPKPRPNWDMVKRRNWESCVDYNFLSAGQGTEYSYPTFELKPDDMVAAYITAVGYVGIGEIKKESVPIIDFKYQGKALNGLPKISNYLFDNSDPKNPKSEHCVSVDWITHHNRNNALNINKNAYGFYAPRGTVTKIDREKHADTIDVLEKFFKVLFIYN